MVNMLLAVKLMFAPVEEDVTGFPSVPEKGEGAG